MESESKFPFRFRFTQNNNTLGQSDPSNSGGMRTPPMYTTAASVPFRWEEEPGKPRPCTPLIPLFPTPPPPPSNKYLELQLPPRLIITYSPSPTPTTTTVFNQPTPYVVVAEEESSESSSSSSSISNSMRFNNNNNNDKKKKNSTASFGSHDYEMICSSSSSRRLLGDMVLIKNNNRSGKVKGKTGFFSSWPPLLMVASAGRKNNSTQNLVDDHDHHDLDLDLSFSKQDEITKMKKRNHFSFISHVNPSSFLASLCEGIKHVIPLKMISRTRTVKKMKMKKKNPNRFITPPT